MSYVGGFVSPQIFRFAQGAPQIITDFLINHPDGIIFNPC